MKAIILAAGLGSRISPMTDNLPKCLLLVGGITILERMIHNIQSCGINEIIFVLGHCQEKIQELVNREFPNLNTQFILNNYYKTTNTGYSLMLTKDAVKGSSFVKFDADVVFDIAILKRLIAYDCLNCLCIDKNIHLDAEEIKVILDKESRVLKVSKSEDPAESAGESIGIEKIDGETATHLFSELERMMKSEINHQDYYESAYTKLIEKNNPFYAMDISGLSWIEIDTKDDYIKAEKIFGSVN